MKLLAKRDSGQSRPACRDIRWLTPADDAGGRNEVAEPDKAGIFWLTNGKGFDASDGRR